MCCLTDRGWIICINPCRLSIQLLKSKLSSSIIGSSGCLGQLDRLLIGIRTGNPRVRGTQPIPVPADTLTRVPAGQCVQVAAGTGIVKGSPRILFVDVHYKSIQSHPTPSSSSSSPSTSAREPTAKTSESITRPFKLQDPRHINAWVDCAESRLRT